MLSRIVRSVQYRGCSLAERLVDYGELLLFPPQRERNSRSRILRYWQGEVSLDGTARVAVFTHFSPRDEIADYVRFHVRSLREAGFAVLFVSNTANLSDDTVATLLPDITLAFSRRNLGWDFAAYRDAINLIPDLANREMLLLTNDSVFGPFHAMEPLLARAQPQEADVWGSTDSWEHHYHLQSFFLLFHRRALAAPVFRQFWNDVRCFRRKYWVIRKYEIGLTRTLTRGGLRCAALFPYTAMTLRFLRAQRLGNTPEKTPTLATVEKNGDEAFGQIMAGRIRASIPANPTHFFWRELVVWMGFPFIKRELLQKNPANVPGVEKWESTVANVSDYDPRLIRNYLYR